MAIQYIDVIQVGARNMQNFDLLKAVGSTRVPILLKRGLSATIEELIYAAEYIAAAGNERIHLCERGIRTYEKATRNTLDISAVPILKQETHLPVLVDVTHSTGRKDIMTPVAKAALAVGADGVMVEVHPEPSVALSDSKQQMNFPEFAAFMNALRVSGYYSRSRIGRQVKEKTVSSQTQSTLRRMWGSIVLLRYCNDSRFLLILYVFFTCRCYNQRSRNAKEELS